MHLQKPNVSLQKSAESDCLLEKSSAPDDDEDCHEVQKETRQFSSTTEFSDKRLWSEPEAFPSLLRKEILSDKDSDEKRKQEFSSARSSSPRDSPPGLVNRGNTCYMNVILQILFHIQGFRDGILESRPSGKRHEQDLDYEVYIELYTLFVRMECLQTVDTFHLVNLLRDESKFHDRFLGQQDAHEFLCFLRDKTSSYFRTRKFQNVSSSAQATLESGKPLPSIGKRGRPTEEGLDCASTAKKSKLDIARPASPGSEEKETEPLTRAVPAHHFESQDIVSKLYKSQLQACRTCPACKTTSRLVEPFQELLVPVISDPDFEDWAQPAMNALNSFCKGKGTDSCPEESYCGKCDKKILREESFCVTSLPPVLTLQVNRFKVTFNKNRVHVHKLCHEMAFPNRTSFSDICSAECPQRDCQYDLTGIVVHQGRTQEQGHYVAFVQHKREWYEISNAHVQNVGRKQMVIGLDPLGENYSTAYTLFYQRVTETADDKKPVAFFGFSKEGDSNSDGLSDEEEESSEESSLPNDKCSPDSEIEALFEQAESLEKTGDVNSEEI